MTALRADDRSLSGAHSPASCMRARHRQSEFNCASLRIDALSGRQMLFMT
jgi:hypothetical protein